MNVKYEGAKFLDFKNELEKINIPEVKVHFVEDSVYHELEGDYVYIYSFNSTPTRKGFGTKAMNKIIDLANKYRIILFLFPYETSEQFYTKFGFGYPGNENNFYEPNKLFKFYNNYEPKYKKEYEPSIFKKIKNIFIGN